MLDGMMKRFSVMKIPVFPPRLAGVTAQVLRDKAEAQPITESAEEGDAGDVSPADTQGDGAGDDASLLENLSTTDAPDGVDETARRSEALLKELATEHLQDASTEPVPSDLQRHNQEIHLNRNKATSARFSPDVGRSGLLAVHPEGDEDDSGSSGDLDDLLWVAEEEIPAHAVSCAADEPVALNMEFISGIRDDGSFAVTPTVRNVRDSCAPTANPPQPPSP